MPELLIEARSNIEQPFGGSDQVQGEYRGGENRIGELEGNASLPPKWPVDSVVQYEQSWRAVDSASVDRRKNTIALWKTRSVSYGTAVRKRHKPP